MPIDQPSVPPRLLEEEYALPFLEALFASSFALMTGFAQSAVHCPHRPLLAAKLVTNLLRLSHESGLSPSMRSMVDSLRMQWQSLVENASSPPERVHPTPLWHTTPSTVQ